MFFLNTFVVKNKMEKEIIYFDRKKSILQVFGGIFIIIASLGLSVIVGGIALAFGIFGGGSLIYFGSKSLSKKPQLIFSEEGIFVGFKKDNLIKKEKIIKLETVKRKVDNKTMNFIQIITLIQVKKGRIPSNIFSREFPVDNLDITHYDLELLIETYLEQYIRNRNKKETELV